MSCAPHVQPEPSAELPEVSPFLFDWFAWYTQRYLRRHFRQVLVDRRTVQGIREDQPLIFCLNHPSWWDPLIAILLAKRFFPRRTHYGPMDAHALESYSIFKRLGFFGVERGTGRGAVRFLRLAQQVLERPATALWITPQGRYADVRERPVSLLPGLAYVVSKLDRGVIVPIALEYVFWDERLPVAISLFGEPINLSRDPGRSVDFWEAKLSDLLGECQDELARRVMARDPTNFEVLIDGTRGLGNWYGWWRSRRLVIDTATHPRAPSFGQIP